MLRWWRVFSPRRARLPVCIELTSTWDGSSFFDHYVATYRVLFVFGMRVAVWRVE